MQRLLPPHLLLLTLIAMALAGWIWPLENDVPLLLRWLFGIVSIIGIAVALKGARTFKDVGTNIKTFKLCDLCPGGWSRLGVGSVSPYRNPVLYRLGSLVRALRGGRYARILWC